MLIERSPIRRFFHDLFNKPTQPQRELRQAMIEQGVYCSKDLPRAVRVEILARALELSNKQHGEIYPGELASFIGIVSYVGQDAFAECLRRGLATGPRMTDANWPHRVKPLDYQIAEMTQQAINDGWKE